MPPRRRRDATRGTAPCAADFYLAAYFQEKRQDADARRLLQAAADGCPVWAPERGFARAELKRLGS